MGYFSKWDAMMGQRVGEWRCVGTAWGGCLDGVTFRFHRPDGAVAEIAKEEAVLGRHSVETLLADCRVVLEVESAVRPPTHEIDLEILRNLGLVEVQPIGASRC